MSESFDGMNPNIGKKFITLEDGSSIEAPEGVRDLQDYNEYLEEQKARKDEAGKQAEMEAARKEAIKLASKIEDSIDESVVKRCLSSKDYSEIIRRLAGVDSVPMKGDQIKIDQDSRKVAEANAKYGKIIGEAMQILGTKMVGEKTVEAVAAAGETTALVVVGDKSEALVPVESRTVEVVVPEAVLDTDNPKPNDLGENKLDAEHATVDENGEKKEAFSREKAIETVIGGLSKVSDEVLGNVYKKWVGDGGENLSAEEKRKAIEDYLNKMSDEDLVKLTDEMKNSSVSKKAEAAEKKEKKRQEMRDALIEDGSDFLKQKGINYEQLEAMSYEDLEALHKDFLKLKELMEKDQGPLKMAEIGKDVDTEMEAKDVAERMLKKDLQEGKGIRRWAKNLWKGQLFRGYFIKKNERKYHDAMVEAEDEYKFSDLSDEEKANIKKTTLARFLSDYEGVVHNKEGGQERKDVLKDDDPAVVAAKKAIEDFVTGKMGEGKEADSNIEEAIKRIKQELADRGDDISINNYREVLEQAKERFDNYKEIAMATKGSFDHQDGVAHILEGFQFIHGEARSGVRTEAHRTGFDNLFDKYEKSKFGKFVPVEIVAGAASAAFWMAQRTGTTAARAALFGLGGAAVTGGVAALKERNRVATDRAQMSREMALGKETGDKNYDKAMAETVYGFKAATSLTEELRSAMASGDREKALAAFADAQVRSQLSDQKKIDLIGFSDPAKVEQERFELDLARAEMRAWLGDEGATEAGVAIKAARETYETDVDSKDAAFKKLRRKQMLKVGLKTAATAAVMTVATQEIAAAFNPDQYGVLDKAFNIENSADAQRTMLAGALGFKVPGAEMMTPFSEAYNGDLTDEEMTILRNGGSVEKDGLIIVDDGGNITSEVTSEVRLGANEYAQEYGSPVSRETWASNGTNISDGNELAAHYTGNAESGYGIVTSMTNGGSVTPSGEVIQFSQLAQNGDIKAFISLTGDSQSTPIEVVGRLLDNGQMEFIPEPGSAAAACFDETGKFIGKYFEVAASQGVTNGVEQIIPLATVVGAGMNEGATFAATVTSEASDWAANYVAHGVREGVAEAVANATTPGGGIPIGFARRDNLTNATRRENQTTTPTEGAPVGPTGSEGLADNGSVIGGGEPSANSGETGGSADILNSQEDLGDEAYQRWWGGMSSARRDEISRGEFVPENRYAREWLQRSGVLNGEALVPTGTTRVESVAQSGENAANPGESLTPVDPVYEMIKRRFGGELGAAIVRGDYDEAPQTSREILYENWWNGLGDDSKEAIRGRSSESFTPNSSVLMEWLRRTGKLEDNEAEPGAGETLPQAA